MAVLKKQGFNLIKLQEHWMADEPLEGRFQFERYEELIAHAATLELGVYLGLTCEQAPHWLYLKHPNCRMVGRDGRLIVYEAPTTLPADGKPGPCYDHLGAMEDQLRFIRRMVQTLGQHANIVVWNTWQEIGYSAEGLVGSAVCFCENTLARFQHWLAGSFGDIDSLNRAWRTRYASWSDMIPSRGAPAARRIAPVDLWWQYFMDNVQVAAILRARADAIRAADPLKRPVFAHKGAPAYGSTRDWVYARTQDFLGSSCYPAWSCGHVWDDGYRRPFAREHALLMEAWDNVAYRYDYLRSANPGKGYPGGVPVWAAEFQGGPISTGLQKGRVPSADDIRRWMLTAIGSGVTAICFWVTRSEVAAAEQHGFGLLDSVGDSTPRLDEAGRIGRALSTHADLFGQPTLERARVGLVVNEWNHQLNSLLEQGGENLAYSLRGWHRLLWDLGVPVDFVSVDHDWERAAEYTVLVVPFPLALCEEMAEKLTRYVEGGGQLICEAAPGRIDAQGFCNRGEMSLTMARLFGVSQIGFWMVREPDGQQRWSPEERTWGEYVEPVMMEGLGPLVGHTLRANVCLETFDGSCGAEPVFRVGEALAGVRRRVGRGQAWLLGTYVGHSGTAHRDPAIHACIRTLLAACGVTAAQENRLVVRKRMTPGKEAWILMNPTDCSIDATLSLQGWNNAVDLLGDGLNRNRDRLVVTVQPLDVRCIIVSR